MPADIAILLDRLARAFDDARDPERALTAAAYMRNRYPFYGIRSAELTRIVRDASSGLGVPTEAELRTLALACWAREEREWQYVACGYLRRHIKRMSSAFLDTARDLITAKSWWDTVDTLASHTVGGLVRAYPELARVMDEWIGSDDIWLARTAILHQRRSKDATDTRRLFGYCLARAGDREFFIRKAIGWALREYSKTDEGAVRTFVDEHRGVLSGLSRTEALKWLECRARRAGA